MTNILIQNRGELPIWGLRLLGLSNKREDQIGRFGTGLKESIALLCRMGAFPVIYSGECRIEFTVLSPDGQEEIHFLLGEPRASFEAGKWYGLGIHPNFGKADWQDPWMIFREIFCNALDEGGTEFLYHDISPVDPSGMKGSTRFYLPMHKELLKAYTEIEDRLLMLSNRQPLFTDPKGMGKIYAKKSKKVLQIFHRGVWVQEGPEVESLFDYDLDDLKLSESRTCDWHTVNMALAYQLLRFPCELLQPVIEKGRTCAHYYEVMSVLPKVRGIISVESGKNWFKAFVELYGDNAVACPNDRFAVERVEARGRNPVVIEDPDLFRVLISAGVPDSSKLITTEDELYETVTDPTPLAQSKFDEIWGVFERLQLTNGKPKPKLRQFVPRATRESTLKAGRYNNRVCYINREIMGTPLEHAACIEEIAHHVSGASDYTPNFQAFLLRMLTDLTGGRDA